MEESSLPASYRVAANPSIERTSPGKPGAASHVKRYKSMRGRLAFLAICSLLVSIPGTVFSQVTCSCMEGSLDDSGQLCLPSAIDGFQTRPVLDERRAVLRGYRNSVGGGYIGPTHRLAITVYFYDREVPDEVSDAKEVRAALAEILRSHKGARVEMGGKGSLPLAGNPTEAHGGVLTWREGSNDYASFLWLIPRTSRWIKIRGTYVRPLGGEAEAMRIVIESIHKVVSSICVLR